MRPVQAELEVPASTLDEISTQLAQLGSQQSIFERASQLQASASLLATSLLPAKRIADELTGLDGEACLVVTFVHAVWHQQRAHPLAPLFGQ